MIKIFITGFSGFVSKHFIDYLEQNNIKSHLLGVDIAEPEFTDSDYTNINWEFKKLNLFDKEDLEKILIEYNPDYILHLAAYSSVAFSWKNPDISIKNNITIFLNLIETVRKQKIKCRILAVGSSEIYGNVNKTDLPLNENSNLNPNNPYAVARVSQELIAKVYVESFGVNIILTRSFNHIGPGQKDKFVIPSFAKQLVEISRQNKQGVIETGDVSIIRDFTDVRDVVNAYYLLLKSGKAGEVYNICSGKGYSLKEVIQKMSEELDIKVTIKQREDLIRPNDNKVIIGSNKKTIDTVGWKRKYEFKDTLIDVINDFKGYE